MKIPSVLVLAAWILCMSQSPSYGGMPEARIAAVLQQVKEKYPELLTNPEKKKRKSMAQFGYNLSYFSIPLFPIRGFIEPDDFGTHSYGKPSAGEKNGCIYTYRGGFIDFSHIRVAADWTVYLALKIISEDSGFDLPPEAGTLHLQIKNTDQLTETDILNLAQKIAFERLTWHEVASWYYHPPYHLISEQASAFTPEDQYSNFAGTEIGKRIAARIMKCDNSKPYSEIATEEIRNFISMLEPVSSKKETKRAYDKVDRSRQKKLPAAERNSDVWWDSRVIFRDQRYVFKRNLDIGPVITPWCVENFCGEGKSGPQVFHVPGKTQAGLPLYLFYEFRITPDPEMFKSENDNGPAHDAFSSFRTEEFHRILSVVSAEMEKVLLSGFDRRDDRDPVLRYKNLRRIVFASS